MALLSRCLQDLAIANVELLTYARQCVKCFTYIMSVILTTLYGNEYYLHGTGEKIEVLKFTSKFVKGLFFTVYCEIPIIPEHLPLTTGSLYNNRPGSHFEAS